MSRKPDLGTIFELLPLLPPTSPAGNTAALALKSLIERATPEAIAEFDRRYRQRTCSGPPRLRWATMELGSDLRWARDYPATVALATLHESGFVREWAVRALGECHDGIELPFLLLRLNDWIPPVRFVAASAVRKRVDVAHAKEWVRCAGLLERIRGGRRSDHGWLRGVVDKLLQGEECRAVLEDGMLRGPLDVRRACFRIVGDLPDPLPLMRLALHDPDPLIKRLAAEVLCEGLERESLREVLAVLQRGPGRLRCLALETACERLPDEAEPLLRAALVDRATLVRDTARFKWQKMGLPPLDFAAFYRDELAVRTGEVFVSALRGLADTGTAADIPLFLKYADDPSAHVREAAVLGLGRCDGAHEHVDRLAKAIVDDPSHRVANAARRYAKLYFGSALPERPKRTKLKPARPSGARAS